ncbi:MAG: hypothetical protein EOP11_15945, partial [Proteobacteria bacterium]
MIRSALVFLALSITLAISAPATVLAARTPSEARQWNEALLQSIRLDVARPTVAVRNLFHVSIALYDAWAIFTPGKAAYLVGFRAPARSPAKMRDTAMAYAAFRILEKRYERALKKDALKAMLLKMMAERGLDPNAREENETTGIGIGNKIARTVLENFARDGSREEFDYATPEQDFPVHNPPIIVKRPGYGTIGDLNFWQPMAMDFSLSAAGVAIPLKISKPLTLHWGRLPPFALTSADLARDKQNVYLDPGAPAQFAGPGHAEYVASHEQLIEFSSWLDPKDGVKIDISPRAFGNNSLGKNDGRGHAVNPATGRPYAPQVVSRGDFTRVLAEFWADGPNSETPPGHWNTMANWVSDRPEFTHRWNGAGDPLPSLEWDVKMYLTLNGALYDASITAWGLKAHYQGSRPITAVRYLADLGQASDPKLPRYHPHGLHLKPGVIELITPELTHWGERFAHLVGHEGEIAIRSWMGGPMDPA